MNDGVHPVTTDVPTTLYLVRHGETEYNRRGIMQGGGIDSTLNATGREQARALACRLASVDIDALYASTLRRATQTADILAAEHEPLSRTHLRSLTEMDWGVYEGEAPSPERDASVEALKSAWRDGAYDRGPEGGESIREVQGRARQALRHILAREAGGTALVSLRTGGTCACCSRPFSTRTGWSTCPISITPTRASITWSPEGDGHEPNGSTARPTSRGTMSPSRPS